MGGSKSKLILCCNSADNDHRVDTNRDNIPDRNKRQSENEQSNIHKSSYVSDHYETIDDQRIDCKQSLKKHQKSSSLLHQASRVVVHTTCQPMYYPINKYEFTTPSMKNNSKPTTHSKDKKEISMLTIVSNFLQQRLYMNSFNNNKNSCNEINNINTTITNSPFPDVFQSLPEDALFKQSQILGSQQFTVNTDNALIENNNNHNSNLNFTHSSEIGLNQTACHTSYNSTVSPNQPPALTSPCMTMAMNYYLESIADSEDNLSVRFRQETNNGFKYLSQVAEFTIQNVNSLSDYLRYVEFDLDLTENYSIESKQILFQQSFSKHGIQSQVIHTVFNSSCFSTPRDLLYLKVSERIDDCQFIVAYRSISFNPVDCGNITNEPNSSNEMSFANRRRINSNNIYRHNQNSQQGTMLASSSSSGQPKPIEVKRTASQSRHPTEENQKYKRALLGLSGKRIVFDPAQRTIRIQEHITLDMRTQQSFAAQRQTHIQAIQRRVEKIKDTMLKC